MAKRQIRPKQNNTKPLKKKKILTTKKRPVQDARQKLIQKKRLVVRDARDVLAKIAKGQDARAKINKLREIRKGTPAGRVKIIGHNIVQKVDRDGKISLVTNKPKTNTGMNVAIQKELGLITAPKKVVRRMPQNRILTEQVVKNYDQTMYKWAKPGLRGITASQMIGSLKPQNFVINKLTHPYVDLDAVEDDEEMPLITGPPMKQTISLQGSSRISNIHSRLDNPMDQETHGIFGQPKTKVVVPAGHRIVVSNLQPTVTQDDVKELFEDIGQLLAARLVRPGVAEVIYKNLPDAQKAVETYHNRQLDGQPMKCLLVNKRPLNNPTAPAISKLESQGVMEATKSAKLVPDLSTIHKVLFQRK